MKTLNLIQGSDEWKSARQEYFTASEASVMMACSKNVSRNELLRMKATGTEQEFSEWFEVNILEKGHEVEALARPIAEAIIGDELFPVTGVDEQTNLLASFDGLTMMEDTCWECKQYNADKVEQLKRQEMPEVDQWQVVQQLVVSGADKCLYMVTDGTEENSHYIWVSLAEGQREKLIAGWGQFAEDAKEYQPTEAKPEVIAEVPADLPTLLVEVVGEVRSSNLATAKDVILSRIDAVSTDLVTDQDFADADAAVKFFDKGEKQLEAVKEQALAQTASIDDLFKTIDALKKAMRTKRLALNKLVKEKKEQIRTEIIMNGKQALQTHIAEVESNLDGYRLPMITADFAAAIKGKKTVKSLQSAADDELARVKVEANQATEAIQANLKIFLEEATGYDFLFADKQQLMTLGADHLKAEITSRIATHKEQERIKAEQERKRIQAEAEAKAQREAEAKAEAERERVRQEERAKAQAEEAARQEALAREQKAAKPEQVQQEAPATTLENEQPAAQPYFQMPTGRALQAEEMISIPVSEYEQLKQDSGLLAALRGAGVDSWDGYDFAVHQWNNAA